ncbi:CaiB/BaiF CoA transferase family protein [Streptomonospora nanhaiensis]|uniref:Crotonobetainyl-CoA:carnitine CoA-transferase CaiB-like acyl-CoA transferase n=1 Tax=Streptomonospora nanhaiensis TaxID=1323731 RepID=A0A853BW81_9ACTN|nr:CoA transferase [Streptomonospora nanhaiensis]MBV2365400.1 CoA transferase [Streptomonospora nanhaiensis]MBX9390201.1 CoA transferase [Streptomonospora nanhaiensis]NYI99005.1 crotonobetainyl-CoA:carnitine CoA-transferase CaiB-like acyl-CoA transferase [Streptomonospora nanhaiensis]
MKPLDGFRVLDLTRFLSGPYCTMVLAELGADVIKVEQPITGDDSRRLAPKVNGESYPFGMPNRSKRSVSLDLKDPRGRDVFLRLAQGADLVIENFRPGVVARLGIDHETLRAANPALIYCSISGFGQTGPYRDRPGFDIMAQGAVGFLRMTGHPDGRPAKVGIAVNDIAAGATAIYSILAAELNRRATGQGDYIDISLVDAGLAWTVWESGAYFGSGEEPAPTGTRHRRSTPYQAYRTADGYVTIGANNDRLWHRLVVDALERPAWLEDERFATLPARMAHIDELQEEIEAITTTRPTAEWIKALDRAGVPGGPVLTYAEALADPHVIARGMVAEVEHPIVGTMRTIAPPAKFGSLEFEVKGPAPWLGQHTRDVLADAGLSEAEIAELYAAEVAYDAHPELHDSPAPQER